jgi:hypothetical protein
MGRHEGCDAANPRRLRSTQDVASRCRHVPAAARVLGVDGGAESADPRRALRTGRLPTTPRSAVVAATARRPRYPWCGESGDTRNLALCVSRLGDKRVGDERPDVLRGSMGSVSWLDPFESRIGLGCMRLPADERLARDTIAAAAGARITVFDTAHAYGADRAGLGHNERLLARALRAAGWQRSARIVTKGGMTRPSGAWVPDGCAKAIAADCGEYRGARRRRDLAVQARGVLPADGQRPARRSVSRKSGRERDTGARINQAPERGIAARQTESS